MAKKNLQQLAQKNLYNFFYYSIYPYQKNITTNGLLQGCLRESWRDVYQYFQSYETNLGRNSMVRYTIQEGLLKSDGHRVIKRHSLIQYFQLRVL